jgi:hypothetical protein
MATLPTMASEMKKLSFAKVRYPGPPHSVFVASPDLTSLSQQVAAASASKDSTSVTTFARNPAPPAARDRQENGQSAPAASIAIVPEAGAKDLSGLKDLKLETRTPNLVVNGSSNVVDKSANAGNSQTPSDDNSQRADSNSELGTKPPSVDGKSITSGTTFALDEKESLRPDDSASVKAAAEDDDAFSVRGSYIAGSRMGSDIAARFQRIQLGDMPLRPIATAHAMPGHHGPGIATPQSGGSEKQPVTEAKIPLVGGAAVPDALAVNGFLSKNPDEKLLEAMQSQQNRLFLLRLEQQVIEFVQDSKYVIPSSPFDRFGISNSRT